MKRKKTDVVQLSKIRMREDLRARLAQDAERKGVTLNGEIVARLDASYKFNERIEEMKLANEARVQDWQAEAEKWKAEVQRIAEEAKAEIIASSERTQKEIGEVEAELAKATTALNVVDAIIGEDKGKRELMRRLVLEIASWPEDWESRPDLRQRLAGIAP